MNDSQDATEPVARRALADIHKALAARSNSVSKLTKIAQIVQAAGVVPFVPSYPRIEQHLRNVGQATLGEISAALHLPLSTIESDLGSMHDNGVATRYGTGPNAIARWEG